MECARSGFVQLDDAKRTWLILDLGASYPRAVGHNDGSLVWVRWKRDYSSAKGNDEAMPVEECGNMLIMTLSYTQASGDNFLIDTYVWLVWLSYLTKLTASLVWPPQSMDRLPHRWLSYPSESVSSSRMSLIAINVTTQTFHGWLCWNVSQPD